MQIVTCSPLVSMPLQERGSLMSSVSISGWRAVVLTQRWWHVPNSSWCVTLIVFPGVKMCFRWTIHTLNLMLPVAVPWDQRHIFEGDVTGHMWGKGQVDMSLNGVHAKKSLLDFLSLIWTVCKIYSSYFSVGLKSVSRIQIIQESSHRNN